MTPRTRHQQNFTNGKMPTPSSIHHHSQFEIDSIGFKLLISHRRYTPLIYCKSTKNTAMKLLLNLLLSASGTTSAYLSSSPSILVHRRHHTINNQPSRPNTRLYYKEPGSSSNDGTDSSANVWSVLANTEKWISVSYLCI